MVARVDTRCYDPVDVWSVVAYYMAGSRLSLLGTLPSLFLQVDKRHLMLLLIMVPPQPVQLMEVQIRLRRSYILSGILVLRMAPLLIQVLLRVNQY